MRHPLVVICVAVILSSACGDASSGSGPNTDLELPDEDGVGGIGKPRDTSNDERGVGDPGDPNFVPLGPDCTGDFHVSTLAGLEALAGCVTIEGDLIVEGIEEPAEMRLPLLEEVGVEFTIRDNPGLTRVELPRLTDSYVVRMNDNPALTELVLPGGFAPSELSISRNPLLTHVDLSGSTQLEEFVLNGNPLLTQLDLPRVEELWKMLVIDCVALSVISAPSLGVVGTLELRGNASLESLALPVLVQVGGSLMLESNPSLTDLEFPMLAASGDNQATGLLAIADNASLERVSFPVLSVTGPVFRVWDNPVLTTLGVPSLREESTGNGSIDVARNPKLTTLDFSSLVQMGDVVVSGNPALTQLKLPVLQDVDFVNVEDCAKLTALDLPSVTRTYGVSLTGNPALERLRVPLAPSFNTGLTLIDNAALTTVEAPLVTIFSRLVVTGNAALTGLSFPQAGLLSRVEVVENPRLQDMLVPALSSLYGDFIVRDNPMLPTCQAQAMLDADPSYIGMADITIDISGNDDTGVCM